MVPNLYKLAMFFLSKLVWFIRYSTEKYKKVGRKEGCMPIAGSLDWRSFFVRPAARLKGTFNDYVDKKRWVGGPKMPTFVHVWDKNVQVEIGRWSKRDQSCVHVAFECPPRRLLVEDNTNCKGRQFSDWMLTRHFLWSTLFKIAITGIPLLVRFQLAGSPV